MGLLDKIMAALGLKSKQEEIKLEPDTIREYSEAKSWKQRKEKKSGPVYRHKNRK